jgi:hypothetical protein
MNQNDEDQPTAVPRANGAKPAGEARAPWGWGGERSVWTDRMLPRLTSGESANRVWFSLLDKTDAPANLQSAYEQVVSKGGCAGGG